MTSNDLLGGVLAVLGNLVAWVAHTEQIWFPVAGAYIRFVGPSLESLPDLRGPFLALTLLYIGLRIGDLLAEKDDLET